MLYITFKKTEDTIIDVDGYFDDCFEPEWLEDTLVKEMILDVDKSEVQSPYCIMSPVLGQIPPAYLSGGVKALILMLKTDLLIWATSCGDNCSKWIYEISKMKDITISLTHLMLFDKVEAFCLDTEEWIHNQEDLWHCTIECLPGRCK